MFTEIPVMEERRLNESINEFNGSSADLLY